MLNSEWTRMSGTRELTRQLRTHRIADAVYFEAPVASLAPWHVNNDRILIPKTPPEKIKAIIVFPSYVLDEQLVKAKVAAAGLTSEFHIPHSTVVIYSKAAITDGNYEKLIFGTPQ